MPGLPGRMSLAARAVRYKLRAVRSLGTFWPAAIRGGKLLACGRLRDFARKLLNETAAVRAGDATLERAGPPLVLAGHILRPGGYDHLVLALLDGLLKAGVNVLRDRRSVLNLDLVPAETRPAEARGDDLPRLAVVPPHLLARFHPDRHTAAFTMWETDTLPEGAVRSLNRCGLIVVPSRWGAECFRAAGVHVPIEVVPLGHDPRVFQPLPDGGQGMTTFGIAGALDAGGLRKNIARVVALFRRAFPVEPDVRLRVKITPTSPMVETHGDPRIDVIRDSLTPEQFAGWYGSLTAFVNASFGEGFGLHLLESMACGRPLISTAFGGVSEFFDESVGYVVGHRLIEARNDVYSGRWADPDDGEMIEAMRRAHRDRREAVTLGERAADRARRFTWDRTVARLVGVLQRHRWIDSTAAAIELLP